MLHYVPPYFIHPTNPITINLIGVGGTGSLILTRLVQINASLLALGHKGITVCAWDPDKFSEANKGRQNMSPSDVGRHKAEVLISRINRTYGFGWSFENRLFNASGASNSEHANITISCVDSGASRVKISKELIDQRNYFATANRTHPRLMLYWLDLGNARHTGQVILGTLCDIKQPGKKGQNVGRLPHVLDFYPDIKSYDKPDEPSCSVAESLRKQSLMINAQMAVWGGQVITDMLFSYKLSNQGVYINLSTYNVNPIPIKQWVPQETKD